MSSIKVAIACLAACCCSIAQAGEMKPLYVWGAHNEFQNNQYVGQKPPAGGSGIYHPANNNGGAGGSGIYNPANNNGAGGNGGGVAGIISCNYGRGRKLFDKGNKEAKLTFDISYKYLGNDCDKLDTLMKTLLQTCPYKGCQRNGYNTGVNQAHTKFQAQCVSDCAGAGAETGHRLGVQFCAVGAQAAPALMSGDITKQVCNAVESTTCYTTMDDFINSNCPGIKDANMDFYTTLGQVCMITSR